LNKKPISIGLLQRHAMDAFYDSGGQLPQGKAANTKKVACIGAGPASLACAAELRRLGFGVTVFDRNALAGGLNTYGVAQYKLAPTDSAREVELIRSAGVEFRNSVSVGEGLPIEDLEREFDAVFIGIGLGLTQPLGISGEKLPGVYTALEFIAAYKTFQPLPQGDRVAVIGGGNTAIDAAVAAKYLGALQVSVVYRRSRAQMSAFAFEYDHAVNAGVHFVWQAKPRRIAGSHKVEALECEGGLNIPCDNVIIAIGQSRLLDTLSRLRGVETRNGQVIVNGQTGQTANPKYFAGGDCVNGGREVVDAAAEGKRAAQGITAWLT
jgi:glutamate synthase (NADPH/NADH) small chain